MQNFSVSHFPICVSVTKAWWHLGCGQFCAWPGTSAWAAARPAGLPWRECVPTSPGPWLHFNYISLGLGRCKLSFINLLSNSLWACAGPFPSRLFPGSSRVSCPHPLWSFPGFSQGRLLPFLSLFWLSLGMPQSSALPSGFYFKWAYLYLAACTVLTSTMHVPCKGIFPLLILLPPSNLDEQTSSSLGKLENWS